MQNASWWCHDDVASDTLWTNDNNTNRFEVYFSFKFYCLICNSTFCCHFINANRSFVCSTWQDLFVWVKCNMQEMEVETPLCTYIYWYNNHHMEENLESRDDMLWCPPTTTQETMQFIRLQMTCCGVLPPRLRKPYSLLDYRWHVVVSSHYDSGNQAVY